MIRTQIQLTEKQFNALKKMSALRKLSTAELLRQATDEFIKTNTGMDIEEKRKRVLEIAGKYDSGIRDMAKNHDKYLAQIWYNENIR